MANQNNTHVYDTKTESFDEFHERFLVQNSEALTKAAGDGMKKAVILVNCLPVEVITELQRKLKPVKLSEADYKTIVANLTSQYETKKSIVGASVIFISRNKRAGKILNLMDVS